MNKFIWSQPASHWKEKEYNTGRFECSTLPEPDAEEDNGILFPPSDEELDDKRDDIKDIGDEMALSSMSQEELEEEVMEGNGTLEEKLEMIEAQVYSEKADKDTQDIWEQSRGTSNFK